MQLALPKDRVVSLSGLSAVEFVEEFSLLKSGHDFEKLLVAHGLDAAVNHAGFVANSDAEPFAGTPFDGLSDDLKDVCVVFARLRASYQGRLHEPLRSEEHRILKYFRVYARKARENATA